MKKILFIVVLSFSLQADIKNTYQKDCLVCHGVNGSEIYNRCSTCHSNYKNNELTKRKFINGVEKKLLSIKYRGFSPSEKKCPSLLIPKEMKKIIKNMNREEIKKMSNFLYKGKK